MAVRASFLAHSARVRAERRQLAARPCIIEQPSQRILCPRCRGFIGEGVPVVGDGEPVAILHKCCQEYSQWVLLLPDRREVAS